MRDKIQALVDSAAEESLRQAFNEHPEQKESMRQKFKRYGVEPVSDELLFESFKHFTQMIMYYLHSALPGILRNKN